MEFKVVSTGEQARLEALHPELAAVRPDLAAFPFPENPVPPADDFPYLFYVLDEGRIAGHRRAVPDTAFVDGRPIAWSWGFDSMIEPDYRGRGIGRRLVSLQVEEMDRRGIASAAAFSAPAMLRIYERLNFHVGHAPRLCLVRRSRPFLSARVPGKALLAGASALGDLAFALERRVRRAMAPSDRFAVEPVDDGRFAELFDRSAVRAEPGYWADDARWVLARKRPADRLYQLARSGAEDPCALLVVRERRPESSARGETERPLRRLTLMHFAVLDRGADVPRIIAAALSHLLLASRADAIDAVTSSPQLIAALASLGFRARGEGMSFSYKLPPARQAEPRLTPDKWHLTHFCSDGFLFE